MPCIHFSSPVSDRSSSPVPDRFSSQVQDRSSSPVPDCFSSQVQDRSSSPVPDRFSSQVQDRSSSPVPDRSSSPGQDSSSDESGPDLMSGYLKDYAIFSTTRLSDAQVLALEKLAWYSTFKPSICSVDRMTPRLGGSPCISMKSAKSMLVDLLPALPNIARPCCANFCMGLNGEPWPACVVATHKEIKSYFVSPLTQQLQAEYAVPTIARRRDEYMRAARAQQAARAHQPLEYSDFWDGKLGQELLSKDIIVLSMTTDGVEIGGNSMWPILLFNLCDLPAIRAQSPFPAAFIPGNVKHLGTFMATMIDEYKELERSGVQVWHSARQQVVHLKVKILVFSADLPAMAKMMGLKGTNALVHCRFCTSIGVWYANNRHYCYTTMFSVNGEDPRPRKNLKQDIIDLYQITDNATRDEAKRSLGVSAYSPPRWPHSFGLDLMHLVVNVARLHANLLESGRNERARDPSDGNIFLSLDQIRSLDALLRDCSKIPTSVARRYQPFTERGKWKAVDWQAWVLQISVPFMYAVGVDSRLYDNWRLFVEGVRLATKTCLSSREVDRLDWCFKSFIRGFEILFGRLDKPIASRRLKVCTSQIHALTHIAECIRKLGPAWVFWQFPAERFMGTLDVTSLRHVGVGVKNHLELRRKVILAKALFGIQEEAHCVDAASELELVDAQGRKYARLSSPVPGSTREWRSIELFPAHGTAKCFGVNASNSYRGVTRSRSYIKFSSADGTSDYGLVDRILIDETGTRCTLYCRRMILWTDRLGRLDNIRHPTAPAQSAWETPYPAIVGIRSNVVPVDAQQVLAPIGLLNCPRHPSASEPQVATHFIVQTWRIEMFNKAHDDEDS